MGCYAPETRRLALRGPAGEHQSSRVSCDGHFIGESACKTLNCPKTCLLLLLRGEPWHAFVPCSTGLSTINRHNHHCMHKQLNASPTYYYCCLHAECRRRRCLCHAKQSSTRVGTTGPPPVFVSPDLAGSAADGATLKRQPPPPDPTGKNGILSILRRTIRATERRLSNLQLAIAELAILAFLSGVGTIIDQEQVSCTATLQELSL